MNAISRIHPRLRLTWAALLVAVLGTASACADTIIVRAAGSGDHPTIQAAIAGDEVVLEPGSFTGDGSIVGWRGPLTDKGWNKSFMNPGSTSVRPYESLCNRHTDPPSGERPPGGDGGRGTRGGLEMVEQVGQWGGPSLTVTVSGTMAYLGVGSRLVLLDIRDPTNPSVVGRSGPLHGVINDIAVSGDYAYVGARDLDIIDISDPESPTKVATYYCSSDSSPGTHYIFGVAVSADRVYVAAGSGAFHIVDVSDPTAPVRLFRGNVAGRGLSSDLAISGNYVFFARYYTLTVVDVANPNSPIVVSVLPCVEDTVNFEIVLSDSLVYLANGLGLQVIDVADPEAPYYRGAFATPETAEGLDVQGQYACVADQFGGLQVIDIALPDAPAGVGQCDTIFPPVGVALSGDYAYVATFMGGLQVVSIADANEPVLVGGHDEASGEPYAVAVSGDYAYLGTRWGEFAIIDIGSPGSPVQVGECYLGARVIVKSR